MIGDNDSQFVYAVSAYLMAGIIIRSETDRAPNEHSVQASLRAALLSLEDQILGVSSKSLAVTPKYD